MSKKYLSQIRVGLFTSIVGGMIVYYTTIAISIDNTDIKAKTVKIDNYSNLNLKIVGSSNKVYLNQGKTILNIKDIRVVGSSKNVSYTIPPNYKVTLEVLGSSNNIEVSFLLRDLLLVDDIGSSNYIHYRHF